jgi:hypothetical protein
VEDLELEVQLSDRSLIKDWQLLPFPPLISLYLRLDLEFYPVNNRQLIVEELAFELQFSGSSMSAISSPFLPSITSSSSTSGPRTHEMEGSDTLKNGRNRQRIVEALELEV